MLNASEVSILVAVLGLILATVYNALSARRASRADVKQNASDMTTMLVKLENISTGVTEIKADMRNTRADVAENRERIVAVEASTKQAHKRLDTLEGRADRGARA